VIPIGLSEDWNLIVRWITPLISQRFLRKKMWASSVLAIWFPRSSFPLPNQAR
jgi:hypothetical protein